MGTTFALTSSYPLHESMGLLGCWHFKKGQKVTETILRQGAVKDVSGGGEVAPECSYLQIVMLSKQRAARLVFVSPATPMIKVDHSAHARS